jgi:hypothetical protein
MYSRFSRSRFSLSQWVVFSIRWVIVEVKSFKVGLFEVLSLDVELSFHVRSVNRKLMLLYDNISQILKPDALLFLLILGA